MFKYMTRDYCVESFSAICSEEIVHTGLHIVINGHLHVNYMRENYLVFISEPEDSAFHVYMEIVWCFCGF